MKRNCSANLLIAYEITNVGFLEPKMLEHGDICSTKLDDLCSKDITDNVDSCQVDYLR